jgi:hypothetical protein
VSAYVTLAVEFKVESVVEAREGEVRCGVGVQLGRS